MVATRSSGGSGAAAWRRSGSASTTDSRAASRSRSRRRRSSPTRPSRSASSARRRSAAALSHPHLVSVYDYGYEGDRPYLVSEFVDGSNLAGAARPRVASRRRRRSRRRCSTRSTTSTAPGSSTATSSPATSSSTATGRILLTDFGIAQPARRDRPDQRGPRRRDAVLPRPGGRARRAGDRGLRPLLARRAALPAVLGERPRPDREADRRPDQHRTRPDRPASADGGAARSPSAESVHVTAVDPATEAADDRDAAAADARDATRRTPARVTAAAVG